MGQFQSGGQRPPNSGRKRGTPNRKTRTLEEIFARAKLSVPEEIIKLLPELEPEKRVDVLMQLMGFFYPRRKSVEHFFEPQDIDPYEKMSDEEIRRALLKMQRDDVRLESDPETASALLRYVELKEADLKKDL